VTTTRGRVRIRAATPADAEAIADVHATSVRELGGEAYDDRQIAAWLATVRPERYPLSESGFRLLVAERTDGDEIVGFGLLDLEPSSCDGDSTGRIGVVSVDPDRAREGIGRSILAALEAAARDCGLETLVLTASKNAIGFYDRLGFEGVDTLALEMVEGVALECLQMRKRLDVD
jgi:putative acetyltransferase